LDPTIVEGEGGLQVRRSPILLAQTACLALPHSRPAWRGREWKWPRTW
jgi:hypothetical protein